MEELPLTKAYLESLTNADLFRLADNLGIDISQNPDRDFLIEELIDVSSFDGDESINTPEEEMTDLVFVESAPLPRYYNITFIEVMIRDPFWAFVFWEIKASEKEQLEKAQEFNGYYLRVKLLNNAKLLKTGTASVPDRQGLEEMLTVQVSPTDTAWYLGFAPTVENEALEEDQSREQKHYKVELCASVGDVETVLAVSNTLIMPGLPELPNKTGKQDLELSENRLIRLSGYGDFHVLRRNERPLRAKREVQPYNE